MRRQARVALLVLGVLLAGCAPPRSQPTGDATSAGAPPPAARQRLTASIFSDPKGLYQELTNPSGTTGSVPGLAELQDLMHAGASYLDDAEVLQPRLAEAIPSLQNGLWQVFPDGRMETTWHLKPNVVWHDGTPFSAEDLVFGARVTADKEIGIVNPPPLSIVESVEAPDARTVVVRWKETFIEADSMFAPGLVLPMPRHVLEKPYAEDKAGLLNHPYWREEYIGVGPFRLREWVPGSHLTLTANEQYVLGRPKLDEIEIRFITDFNTVIANLLAESIDKHIGRGFGVEQVLQIRDTAKNQNVLLGGLLGNVVPMYPQFVNTDPPIVTNVEFRRALSMAVDRQEMADTVNYGLGPVAHTWLQPDRAEFSAVESKVVRYEYDPRRATQTLESLGYSKAPDGVFRDATGQRLHLELRTTDQLLIQPRSAFSVADYWKRLGLDVETNNVPNQLIPDREYRSQFPAFELVVTGLNTKSSSVRQFSSSNSPLPETRFTGGNRARYQNREFDSLIDRYVSTIPMTERLAALGDIVHQQTDQLTMLTFFYQGGATVLGATRLKGVTSAKVWNAHLWYLE